MSFKTCFDKISAMSRDKDLVGSLPGSQHGSRSDEGVTNHTLMPQANKLPGKAPPPPKATPAPQLLGSGSKIPESLESRMRSQFATPDPAIYARKRRDDYDDQGGLAGEVRSSIPCSSYKSNTTAPTNEGTGLLSKRVARQKAEKAERIEAKQKADTAAEHRRLRGQKEMILSNMAMNPAITGGSSEARSKYNQVIEINKKLGLPTNDTGSWRVK